MKRYTVAATTVLVAVLVLASYRNSSIYRLQIAQRGGAEGTGSTLGSTPSFDNENARAPALFIPPRAKSRCLASFFIIGARKGGTTSLYEYISAHPDVYGVRLDAGPKSGELFFVERNVNLNAKKTADVEKWKYKYDRVVQKWMTKAKSEPFDIAKHITGESSVGTSTRCEAAATLRATCGADIRILYLARNPISQMVSRFRMRVRLRTAGYSYKTDINLVLGKQLDDIEYKINRLDRKNTLWYKDTSFCLHDGFSNGAWNALHVAHLERFKAIFGRDKMMVLKSETFFKDTALALRDVYIFLGLDPDVVDVNEVVSRAYNQDKATSGGSTDVALPKQQILSDSLKRRLASFFEPYNDALSNEWDFDVADWNTIAP